MNQYSPGEFERVVRRAGRSPVEWQTLALLLVCYGAWAGAGMLYAIVPWPAVALLAVPIVLHSSLQHEAIHHHPTPDDRWNEALVALPLGLLIPFRRYRDAHLAHHNDSRLTDPYDDPESFYLAASDHTRLPRVVRVLLALNNTLIGRITIGPAIAACRFAIGEARAGLRLHGSEGRQWCIAWAMHGLGVIAVIAIVHVGFNMPLTAYCGGVYLAMALLGVRSFCEHRWADAPDARTVIIERTWLGLLFLHNNLHLVHHKQPHLPWHALPAAYRARREDWLAMNEGYVFQGYRAVLRRYAMRGKEPVVHPEHIGCTADAKAAHGNALQG